MASREYPLPKHPAQAKMPLPRCCTLWATCGLIASSAYPASSRERTDLASKRRAVSYYYAKQAEVPLRGSGGDENGCPAIVPQMISAPLRLFSRDAEGVSPENTRLEVQTARRPYFHTCG